MGYRFRAMIWKVTGESAWHFVTLPFGVSDEIDELTASLRRGFGSVRVRSTIGSTSWATSVFPDAKAGAYVLPVKKQVRLAEGVADGDAVTVEIELVDVPAPADGTTVPSG